MGTAVKPKFNQALLDFKGLKANTRDVLQRGLEDARRHCEWILDSLKHD